MQEDAGRCRRMQEDKEQGISNDEGREMFNFQCSMFNVQVETLRNVGDPGSSPG